MSNEEQRAKLARDARPVKDAPPSATIDVLSIKAMRGPFNPRGLKDEDLIAALNRANRLVDFMAGYIGKMAPGNYHALYSDLNEHFLFMGQHGERTPK